jgi:hypothetical protein
MKHKYLLLILCTGVLSNCGIFNNPENKYVMKSGHDSLFILAQKDTMNLYIDRFYNGRDSIFITKDTNSLLGDTIKLFFHVSGETWGNADTIFTNFYFQNDTFHIYIAYEVRTQDSLSKSFQVLRKTETSFAPSYANIDSLFIFSSSLKHVNTDYDIW